MANQEIFMYSKVTKETPEKDVKYVQKLKVIDVVLTSF